MAQEQQEEKMIVDKLKPTEEMREAPKVDVKMEERVNVADLCAEILKEEGVEYLYYLTGGNTASMLIPMQKAGIKAVHCRHESTAGFAMDGWGRLTRRPGFALIGNGTGLTNFSSGVCQAYAAGSPGVGLVCDSGTFDDDKFGGQGIARTENQFKGLTKWCRRVTNIQNVLFQLKRAFRSTVTPPSGPVVVGYTSEFSGPNVFTTRRNALRGYAPGFWKPNEAVLQNQANPALVEQAVKWLLAAEKPVMIVGHAAHQDDCQEELREFIHLLGLPCHSRRIARGMVSELDPLNYGRRARGVAMRDADRCLVFGLRIGFLEAFGNPPFFPHNVRYCQVHDCLDTSCLQLPTDIEVIGNLKQILKQMIQCAKDMGITKPVDKWEKWRQFLSDTRESYNKRTASRTDKMVNQMPLHPDLLGRYTAEILTNEYKNDYICIIDGYTASSYFTSWNVAVNTGTVLDAAETIGIGHSPGMALAAGLATKRQKPILGLMGDGAVGANGMDIETCVRWDIPVVFLHENNNTLINGSWENFYSKVATPTGDILKDSWETVPDIRYDKMFAELGCHAEFIERPEECVPAMKRAFEFVMREKKPAFVEAFVDMDVIHSNMASPRMLLRTSAALRWEEVPEKGKKLVATQLASSASFSMLPKDWQEGINSYQKK